MATVQTLWGKINLGPQVEQPARQRTRVFKSVPCDGHFIAFEVMFAGTDEDGRNGFESLKPLAVLHSEQEADLFCSDMQRGWGIKP